MELLEKKIVNLLTDNQKIIIQSKEKAKKKGESFNIFSILKLESDENKTHSAFLGELLNPKGSHLEDDKFLKLFLKIINYNNNLDTKKAQVVLEKDIGPVDYKNKTGGRIDIFITDDSHCLSIENKIFAGDQESQINRYCKYNKNKNSVFYLTLDGKSPGENSCGEMVIDEDFYAISYKKTIIEWLEECIKESAEQPILRESIKQYIILIKKLTGQLTDNIMDKKLKSIILENLESAKFISDNYETAVNAVKKDFRDIIEGKIKDKHPDSFIVTKNDISRSNAHLFLKHKSENIQIGIETFNGANHMGSLKIGFWINMKKVNREKVMKFIKDEEFDGISNWWTNVQDLNIDLNDPKILTSLINKNSEKDNIIDDVMQKINEYIDNYLPTFTKFEEKL